MGTPCRCKVKHYVEKDLLFIFYYLLKRNKIFCIKCRAYISGLFFQRLLFAYMAHKIVFRGKLQDFQVSSKENENPIFSISFKKKLYMYNYLTFILQHFENSYKFRLIMLNNHLCLLLTTPKKGTFIKCYSIKISTSLAPPYLQMVSWGRPHIHVIHSPPKVHAPILPLRTLGYFSL